MNDRTKDPDSRNGGLRIAFYLDPGAHPHLCSHLKAILESGTKGAVGQRLANLAALGLMYETQALGDAPEISGQPVVSKRKTRVRVPQSTQHQNAAGEPKKDLSSILNTPGPNPAQGVDSNEDSRVQVPQAGEDGQEAARRLAQSLVGRRGGWGRSG